MPNIKVEKDRTNNFIESQKRYLHLRYKIEQFKLKKRTPPKELLSQAFRIGLFAGFPMSDLKDL